MAEKKKKKMEFRYYQLPPGSPILALLGEKWVQNYGDRTADRLHFHNYMELGYCYYGAGDVVLGDDTYRFSGQQFTVIPSNFPHTTNSDPGNISRWGITCIVSRAMDYISDHYMEPIRVEQLAKYSHLSETHFRRVFTEYMHMGPLEYINTVRIRTACEHLKKTEEPVADIAHKCGFTTNSTFNRNFKQMMGVTPVEWRKRPENYEQRLLNYEIHTEKGW